MRQIKFVLFTAIIAMQVLSFGLANGQNAIYLSSASTGSSNPNIVVAGQPIVWTIAFRVGNFDRVTASTNGFKIHDNGSGTSWPPPIIDTLDIAPTTGYGWRTRYDFGFFIYHDPDNNGNGSDTVGMGGFSFDGIDFLGTAFEGGFDADVLTITIPAPGIDAFYDGRIICLDSSFYNQAGTWLWGANDTKPDWDGPHCYTIKGPVTIDGEWRIRNYTTNIDETLPFFEFEIVTVVGTDTLILAIPITGADGTYSATIPYTETNLLYRFYSNQPAPQFYAINPITNFSIVGVYNPNTTGANDVTKDVMLFDGLQLNNTAAFAVTRVIRDIFTTDSILGQYNYGIDRILINFDSTNSLGTSWGLIQGQPCIEFNMSDWPLQAMCHEAGHQFYYQLANYNLRPPSTFDGSIHYYYSVTDTIFAFSEGFAEFINGISSDHTKLITNIPSHAGSNLEVNDWYLGPLLINSIGEIVEGAVASMLIDIYDDANNPIIRVSDDDGVNNTSYMMPKMLHSLNSSNYSTPTWSFGMFADRLLKDASAPWDGEPQFQLLRGPICQIFVDNGFNIPSGNCASSALFDDEEYDPPFELPLSFNVFQNYPNPFNGQTKILFTAPKPGVYMGIVLNLLGQQVYSKEMHVDSPGEKYFILTDKDTDNWASGVYFYVITHENENHVRKMMYLK